MAAETATENPNFTITEELETFKRFTVDFLQESFVSSFDKINSSIRETNSAQPEEETLKQQIRKVSEENDRLK